MPYEVYLKPFLVGVGVITSYSIHYTKLYDAQGEVSVRVEENGNTVTGHGSDTDIIIASAQAYLNALNKLADLMKQHARAEQKIGLC